MKINRKLLFCLSVAILFPNPVLAEEIVTIKTRPDVTQRFIFIKTKNPRASVILFAGGHGVLNLPENFKNARIPSGKNNFLVRSRKLFSEQGMQVAVVDAPSDIVKKSYGDGMKGGFRTSREHVIDIDHVIDYLRKQAGVPVWLVGTSRGSESAAYIAINSKAHPDGLVLSSSVSVSDRHGDPVTDMELKKISIPVYVVAHAQDDCSVTPPEGAKEIFSMLTASKRKAMKLFTGGTEPKSGACKALSRHGFIGMEKEVVRDIAKFILKL